ncbi:tryptophan-rich antigen [Plasmodium ovale wallikeri]|uniref:Tryptophan-rich antigen n=2 Tax=Plasmodium ovale TaxID=36330 RepID=A0A1A8YP85_PLAOA|nr:tryptophan-rich antigen [Plasmodium ovale wallikeri]SBT33580.1 tryptophan-rich antigen [Plasmodium ovale wallikeri]SBT74068.1 tryptophan-rich protein [Plasmodium ovale]
MEPIKGVDGFMPDTSFVRDLTVKNRNYALPDENSAPAFSGISFALFILSTALLLLNNTPSNPMGQIAHSSIDARELEQGKIYPSSGLNDNEWNDWMQTLEEEWQEFNANIEKKKNKWIEKQEKEWNEWIKGTKNKWIQFNGNMDIASEILKKSVNWKDAQWKNWINKEGRMIIEKDFETWITEKQQTLQRAIMKEWVNWRNNKIKAWLMTKWKYKEEECSKKWDDTEFAKSLYKKDPNCWLQYKQNICAQRAQWLKWLLIKEYVYVHDDGIKWSKWKDDKRASFNEWVESYVKKWISEKQWNVLIKAIKNANSGVKSANNKCVVK